LKNNRRKIKMSPINNKLTRIIILLASLSLMAIAFTSCESDKKKKVETRSLEQIYEDEGVPVRTVVVGNQTLSNEITFLATMSGVEETTVTAKISDKVVSIPVRVGQRVSAGQILATFPTDNAQIQWEQAKTSLENAKKTYDRMKNLLAAGDIAQSNFDGAETQY
jgi:multidrug efflux pump subunit AcrA (membrane-fusion protein)